MCAGREGIAGLCVLTRGAGMRVVRVARRARGLWGGGVALHELGVLGGLCVLLRGATVGVALRMPLRKKVVDCCGGLPLVDCHDPHAVVRRLIHRLEVSGLAALCCAGGGRARGCGCLAGVGGHVVLLGARVRWLVRC